MLCYVTTTFANRNWLAVWTLHCLQWFSDVSVLNIARLLVLPCNPLPILIVICCDSQPRLLCTLNFLLLPMDNIQLSQKSLKWFSELQNVNLFTRSKTIKPNFTRKKARKSRQFWHQNWQRGYFWRTDVDNSVKLWKFRQTFHIGCANLLQKRLHLAKLCVLPNFYPNLPIFLHGYIRHIRDILQLCLSVGWLGRTFDFFFPKEHLSLLVWVWVRCAL